MSGHIVVQQMEEAIELTAAFVNRLIELYGVAIAHEVMVLSVISKAFLGPCERRRLQDMLNEVKGSRNFVH